MYVEIIRLEGHGYQIEWDTIDIKRNNMYGYLINIIIIVITYNKVSLIMSLTYV